MSCTGIPYLDYTWNTVVGCSGVGCRARDTCWAQDLHDGRHAAYLAGKKIPAQYAKPFTEVQCLASRLREYSRSRKPTPKVIGVCFTSELFDRQVPEEFIDQVFAEMGCWAGLHTYVLLTKQAARLSDICRRRAPLPNVYLGVSICNQADAEERLPHLAALAARCWETWISYEPALGDVEWEPWLRCTFGAGEPKPYPAGTILPAGHPGTYIPARLQRNGPRAIVLGCESGPGRRLAKCEKCGGTGWYVPDDYDTDDEDCPQCDGEGLVSYLDHPETWGEDCPSEADHGVTCPECQGRPYHARICHECAGTGYAVWEWARKTRDACAAAGVAYYLKQLPTADRKVIVHPTLDGRQHLDLPWRPLP